jgi:septum formation inhibitor MinC
LDAKNEAEEAELLKAEEEEAEASDDRQRFNSRSAAGSGEMLQRLEMSPEKIEGTTEGFLKLATRLKRSGSKHLQIEGKTEAGLHLLTLRDAEQKRRAEFEKSMAVDEPFEEEPKLSEEEKIEDQNFEVQLPPKLSEEEKPTRILKFRIRSGEFPGDEPRTPADVKEAEETLDDQKTLPATFRGEDDEPEARREEQNRTR